MFAASELKRAQRRRILENDTETKIEDKKEQSDFEELNALRSGERKPLARQKKEADQGKGLNIRV